MKLIILVFIFIELFVLKTFAQVYDKNLFETNFNSAENLLEKGDFQQALLLYQDLLKMDPENANLNFKAGFCYLNSAMEKTQSIEYNAIEFSQ